ncbi:hypothetical protein HDU88_001751 [Geranomyces variabilis]|nr:hypothetical protein HDU88_001751 [Geranomyces variabilis]
MLRIATIPQCAAALRRGLVARTIQTTAVCRAADAAAARVPTPQDKARVAADAWLAEEKGGEQFRDAKAGKFVTNRTDRPFPMNPYFKPLPPLSDETRASIFRLYLEDPQQWTPRALAEHFGLAIVRVQAILRLKALAQKMEAEGKPLQTGLVKGMEGMLHAKTLKPDEKKSRAREQLRLTPAKRLQPFFRMMNEEEKFTPEDAAKLMKMEPYANLQRKLDEDANHVFELEPPTGADPRTLDVDSHKKSRFQFTVTDTGEQSKARLVVREKNGLLRHATIEEKFKRKNLRPKYIM